jgi:hypothetical protein
VIITIRILLMISFRLFAFREEICSFELLLFLSFLELAFQFVLLFKDSFGFHIECCLRMGKFYYYYCLICIIFMHS